MSKRTSRGSLSLVGLLASLLFLSACGGGGGGGSEPSTSALDGTTPDTPPSDTGTPDPVVYMAVRAVDFSGQHGPYSDEVSARLQPGSDVTLAWQAPNTTVDGAECTSVMEYVVSLGPTSAEYTEYVPVRTTSTSLLCRATGTNSCGDVYTCQFDFTVPSV